MDKTGIPELENFISREYEALSKYAAQGNANAWYIDRQNAKMAELISINNEITRLEYHTLWQMLEAEMRKLETGNPQLKGHMILFNADLRLGNYSKIQLKTNSDDQL